MRTSILIIFAALVCAACQPRDPFVATETTISSRGAAIPATFVHPVSAVGPDVPLVVMAHGHGGTRDEAGGFTRVAQALADDGIASIRVDFPGCGDSTEPFTANTVTNMLADIRASRDFALRHARIDASRVGILGYSMGGRLAVLATRNEHYSAVALWAPAATDGIESMVDFLGGHTAYERLRAEAATAGFAVFDTPWGARQELSLQWFTDLETGRPQSAIGDYAGPLLVLYGSNDKAIDPRIPQALVASADRSRPLVEEVVAGAGHGLGFYDSNAQTAAEVVTRTVRFLADNL